jgi:hypothetical protein
VEKKGGGTSPWAGTNIDWGAPNPVFFFFIFTLDLGGGLLVTSEADLAFLATHRNFFIATIASA